MPDKQIEPDGNRIDRIIHGERMAGMVGMDHFRIAAGDRIWRPVDFKPQEGLTMQEAAKSNKLTKVIREFESAELTERQTYLLRASHAQFHVNPDALWAYTPNVRSGGKIVTRVGLVVFLKEPVTPDWTWLIVTSITKKGNALYAQPVNGNKDELLKQYVQPVPSKK
jgi:hypothetical protein